MIEHVWLLADSASGDVSYVEHGPPDHRDEWKTIGPFAYTQQAKATAAAANPRFLPEGVSARLTVLEVEASAFVQSIFNGFPPSQTDVFTLDEHFYPLTSGGAEWVDDALGHPIWGPLFDESGDDIGLGWLDRVLKQVANHLDMKMETVEAIGSLNADAEDAAAEVEQTSLLIQRHVRVAIAPEPDTLALGEGEDHHVLTPAARFWMHTNGLHLFGLPELEIRDVPPWYVQAAGSDLTAWAAYAVDCGISEGDELDGAGPVPFKIEASPSPDPHWTKLGRECLRLEVSRVLFACGHKKHGPGGPKSVH
jgi:hypothetical protein